MWPRASHACRYETTPINPFNGSVKDKTMAKDKKIDTTVSTIEAVQAEPQEVARGERGVVGEASPATKIKQMWHEQCHVLMDVGNKHNPRKQMFVRKQGADSLKKFARKLLAQNDPVAKDWFDVKAGALNSERTDANKSRIALEASASMSARKKKSSKSGKTAATP